MTGSRKQRRRCVCGASGRDAASQLARRSTAAAAVASGQWPVGLCTGVNLPVHRALVHGRPLLSQAAAEPSSAARRLPPPPWNSSLKKGQFIYWPLRKARGRSTARGKGAAAPPASVRVGACALCVREAVASSWVWQDGAIHNELSVSGHTPVAALTASAAVGPAARRALLRQIDERRRTPDERRS